jgi:hypothetical protein
MKLLEVGDLMLLVIMIYLVCHLPAIIMLIIGLVKRKSNPKVAKILFILTAVYFLIGLGICGGILS